MHFGIFGTLKYDAVRELPELAQLTSAECVHGPPFLVKCLTQTSALIPVVWAKATRMCLTEAPSLPASTYLYHRDPAVRPSQDLLIQHFFNTLNSCII